MTKMPTKMVTNAYNGNNEDANNDYYNDDMRTAYYNNDDSHNENEIVQKMPHFSMVSGWNLNFVIIYLLMF